MTSQTAQRWARLVSRLEQEKPAPYCYVDRESRLEKCFGPAKSAREEALLGELLDRAGAAGDALALDMGCGRAERTAVMARRFRNTLGLDPDPARLEVARPSCPTARFFQVGLSAPVLREEAFQGAFSAIQCLQVLGHLPRASADAAMATLAAMLAPKGILVLALPYHNQAGDDFRFSVERDGKAVGQPSSPELFDSQASRPQPGLLPVRHFAMPAIMNLVRSVGLVIEHTEPYQWMSYVHADLMVLARRA